MNRLSPAIGNTSRPFCPGGRPHCSPPSAEGRAWGVTWVLGVRPGQGQRRMPSCFRDECPFCVFLKCACFLELLWVEGIRTQAGLELLHTRHSGATWIVLNFDFLQYYHLGILPVVHTLGVIYFVCSRMGCWVKGLHPTCLRKGPCMNIKFCTKKTRGL